MKLSRRAKRSNSQGQFPGPTIEARSGDVLVVDVYNSLDEETSIHWHGLHMRGNKNQTASNLLRTCVADRI